MPKSVNSLRASIAALHRSAQTDPHELTAAARQGFANKFLAVVDERWPGLSDEERERRASVLRRAHMKSLALSSAKKRARKVSK